MTHPSGLTKGDLAKIEKGIGSALPVQSALVVAADPAWIEHAYLPKITKKGVAWVCLADAAEMLAESRYALVQPTAYRVAYDRGLDPPETQLSPRLFMAQFYMDDTVLRLYATAESVAESIKAFYHGALRYPRRKAETNAPKKRASGFRNLCTAIRVAKFPGNLAAKVMSVGAAPETHWVTDYRNEWMHGQRKRMEGTGLRFGRNKNEPRAKRTTTAKGTSTITLAISPGDPPEITIAEAMDAVTKVYHLLLDLIVTCHETFAADVPTSGPGWKRKWRIP